MDFTVPENGFTSMIEMLQQLNKVKSDYKEVFGYGSMLFPYMKQTDKLIVIQRSFNGMHLFFVFNFDSLHHLYSFEFKNYWFNEGIEGYSADIFSFDEATQSVIKVQSFSNRNTTSNH
jgi:hypothetical protein